MRVLSALVLLSFVVVATGCVDRIVTADDYVAPDFRRPSVEHRVPLNGAVNTPIDHQITIWFDKLMNEESVRELTTIWREVLADNIAAVAVRGELAFAAKANGGVFRGSDVGREWLWRSETNPTFSATRLVVSGGDLIAIADGTIWRSSDDAATFSPSNVGFAGGDALSLTVAPSDASILYLTSEAAGVYRSNDGGATWDARNSGLRLGRPVVAAAVHPSDPDVVIVTTDVDFVYRSQDGGASWVRMRDGLTDRHFVDVAFANSDPSVVYVVAVDGTVYRSADGGATWAVTALDPADAAGFAIAANPADANRVVAATSDGVFSSQDAGQTWSQRAVRTLEGVSIDIEHVSQILFSNDGTLLIASDAGVVRGGATGELLLEDTVLLDNLRLDGTMAFENWRDTTMVVALRNYHDPMSADTAYINPYINERALAAWFANGKQGDPPVEAYPLATKVTFTSGTPLARNALYRIHVPGSFGEDLFEYAGQRGVEDIHGNSKETHFYSSFRTEP
jgi:photosystem II stability/assembly factor-like uncharacterized protein